MRVSKYLFCLYFTIMLYVGLAMIFGEAGVFSFDALRRGKEQQSENIGRLESQNALLAGTRDALLFDKDKIRARARDLGFAESGDHFVRIVGVSDRESDRFSAGETFIPQEGAATADSMLRIIAISCGFFLACLFFGADLMRSIRRIEGAS